MVTTRRASKTTASKDDEQQPKIDESLGQAEQHGHGRKKAGGSKKPVSKKGGKKDEQEDHNEPQDTVESEQEPSKDEAEPKGTKRDASPEPAGSAEDTTDGHADKKQKTSSEPVEHTEAEKKAMKELMNHENVLEYGKIHFLYKPKVETFHPHSIDDVQRMHIILQPFSRRSLQDGTADLTKPLKARLLNIGRKTLPGAERAQGEKRKQPFWGFVTDVDEDMSNLRAKLGESTTETKTRGTRTTPSDRLIATGPYIILLHNTSSSAPTQNPTSLVFRTTLPVEPGEVQKAFRIGKEGAFSLSVKNPKMPNTGRGSGPSGVPGGLRGDQKAEFPKELEEKFGDLRWHPVNPPEFLDTPKAELLFLTAHSSSSHPVAEELGEESSSLSKDMQELADEGDVEHIESAEKREEIEMKIEEEVWKMLRVGEGEGEAKVEGEPAIDGKWE